VIRPSKEAWLAFRQTESNEEKRKCLNLHEVVIKRSITYFDESESREGLLKSNIDNRI
jgi:hypothetical protein